MASLSFGASSVETIILREQHFRRGRVLFYRCALSHRLSLRRLFDARTM